MSVPNGPSNSGFTGGNSFFSSISGFLGNVGGVVNQASGVVGRVADVASDARRAITPVWSSNIPQPTSSPTFQGNSITANDATTGTIAPVADKPKDYTMLIVIGIAAIALISFS